METALQRIAEYTIPAYTREDCENRLRRLKDKGFVNAKNVNELEDQIGRLKYKEKYPNYLFFSDKTFEEIIGRNNLAINTVEHYTGHIPERCVTAILNENVDEKDFRDNRYQVNRVNVRSNLTGYEYDLHYSGDLADLRKEDNRYFEKALMTSKNIPQKKVNKLLYGKKETEGLTYSFTANCELISSWDFTKLYIAAPIPAQIRNTPKPDPIVFRYVKDGVLVITFWEE